MSAFLIVAAIVTLDRLTKYFAVKSLSAVSASVPIIKNVFHLTLSRNTGAAFSFLTGKTVFLSVFSAVVIVGLIWFYFTQKKKNPNKKLYALSLLFILGGAIGNLIDRVFYGYVIDFFDFTLINFPIFNVADCFITVGGIALVAILVFDKEIVL